VHILGGMAPEVGLEPTTLRLTAVPCRFTASYHSFISVTIINDLRPHFRVTPLLSFTPIFHSEGAQ